MPKRRCPSCGKTFSGDGETCPHCGAVLQKGQEQDPWEKKRERDPWEKTAGFHEWKTPPEGCGCPKNPAEKRRMKEASRNQAVPGSGFWAAGHHGALENLVVLAILIILALISIYYSL